MKKHILILLALSVIMLIGCMSLPKTIPGPISYIIDVPEKMQDEIYRLNNEWMVKTFKSAEAVIEYQDKTEGILMGKGQTTLLSKSNYPVKTGFTITIEARDERARLTFEGITPKYESQDYFGLAKIDEEDFKKESDALAADLESYLKTGSEDW